MLELGKNYEIKGENRCGDTAPAGIHRITFVKDGMFMVEGSRDIYTESYYIFTRLPSFSDEVKVYENGKLLTDWKHHYYLGKNARNYFILGTDYDEPFEQIRGKCCTAYSKKENSICLLSAEPDKVKPTKLCAEQIVVILKKEIVQFYDIIKELTK